MNTREGTLSALARQDAAAHGSAVPLEGLLAAVVAASRCMVEHSDFLTGLRAALAELGGLSAHDRASVWELVDQQQVCVCIAEWDAPGIGSILDMAGTVRFPVVDCMEVWRPLLAGEAYQSVTPVKTGANAALNRSVANRSDVMVPIFVDGVCWGCIGFDNCREERRYSEGEIQVLQAAAAAVAAAVQRSRADAARLALVQAQAEQAQAMNRLTQGVVRATRELLDQPDFESGFRAWLAHLGAAAQADVVALIDVSGRGGGPLGRLTAVGHGWRSDGQDFKRWNIPATTDFDDWMQRLLAQEAVWASIDELVDPVSVQFWRETDCATNLLMPVVLDGVVSCVLCFDWFQKQAHSSAAEAVLRTAAESFTAVLHRQRASDQMLAERESRIAIERKRADEAAALLTRVERHAHLLKVAARAADVLLAAPTPADGIAQVLEAIGAATGAERVCYAQLEFNPADPDLQDWHHITVEWTRPGALRQMSTGLRAYSKRRDNPAWEAELARLRAGRWLRQRVDDLPEPHRTEQRQLGVAWSLRYPVIVGERLVALLGFDCAGPFDEFEAATTDAMQSVASAISNALWRHELQEEALGIERERADDSARLAALLSQVVSSSRVLIDADHAGFEAAVHAWLGGLGRETQAIRATFYDKVRFEETGQDTLRMLCEWVREGVEGSVPCSFSRPHVIDPRGAEDLMARLVSGSVIALHTTDTHGAMRAFLESQGNATVVAVPVFVGGRQWGAVSFDFTTRFDIASAAVAVLQTAADTLSAVLRRNETAAALLAEREARLQAEQRRGTELVGLNDALRESLDALAGAEGEAAFLRDVLVRLQQQTGAQTAYLFRSDDADGRLRLLGRASQGDFSDLPAPDDPEMFSRGFDMVPELLNQLKARRRLLWRKVDLDMPVHDEMPESTRWHRQMGHRANAVHALTIGDRQVGFIGLVFDHDEPLSEAALDLAHALCQPITLALELTRLSRLAQRGGEQTAILKERNRLAREIHDGIAQSFLAIQMQLDAVEPPGPTPPQLKKALDLARHGLGEARRAVAALRPQALQHGGLRAAIQRMVAQIDEAGAVRCTLTSPGDWEELPADVEDHVFRIVQEAINNAMRHSGGHCVRVELSQAADETTVLVADDGVGLDLSGGRHHRGFGLESMQQRAQLIGARIDWLSIPNKGTQVLVSWSQPPRQPIALGGASTAKGMAR